MGGTVSRAAAVSEQSRLSEPVQEAFGLRGVSQHYLQVRAVEELVEAWDLVHIQVLVGQQELVDLQVHVLL